MLGAERARAGYGPTRPSPSAHLLAATTLTEALAAVRGGHEVVGRSSAARLDAVEAIMSAELGAELGIEATRHNPAEGRRGSAEAGWRMHCARRGSTQRAIQSILD